MRLGLFFFGTSSEATASYDSLIEQARFADHEGFAFISTPERHFDPFGGAYPSPAVLSAALAQVTSTVQLRAGSVVSPLHDTIRIVEDWSVVDRLSGGRVALSFGSGWNVNDFALAPGRFETRRALMADQVSEVRGMWRGGVARRRNGKGVDVELRLHPRPVQAELPVWLTASRSPETFAAAGRLGCHILTHLENQDLTGLAERVTVYREARESVGLDPRTGVVTVMQHTYVSDDADDLEHAMDELRHYLGAALDLEQRAVSGGGQMSGQKPIGADVLTDPRAVHAVLDSAVEKYRDGLALVGSVATCVRRIQALRHAGADEVACLTDFVRDSAFARDALPALATVNRLVSTGTESTQDALAILMSGGQ